MTTASAEAGPLAGIRVMDLSRFVAGPFCAQILGDMGAEVIKVEPPGGEPARAISPIVRGESLYFLTYNRSKKGITLNFRHPKGPALLRDLLGKSDVLIDNFRPGVLDQMGLGLAVIERDFPRLIHASVLGFGREGPYANLPCFDEIAQAMGGLMSICGWPDGPPMLPGTYMADLSSGLYLGMGILLAVVARQKTGRGQKVDVALFDSVVSLLHSALPEFHLLSRVMGRTGNQNRGISPGNAYRARDGHIVIEAITQGMWESLVEVMGRSDLVGDPRFKTAAGRREHADLLDAIVSEWTSTRTVGELFEVLTRASVACGPVKDVAQVWADPQLAANGQVTEVDHAVLGRVPVSGVVPKLSLTPGRVQGPSPLVGEHNESIYGELLGYARQEIDAFRKEGII